jgi:hypothetical protein
MSSATGLLGSTGLLPQAIKVIRVTLGGRTTAANRVANLITPPNKRGSPGRRRRFFSGYNIQNDERGVSAQTFAVRA